MTGGKESEDTLGLSIPSLKSTGGTDGAEVGEAVGVALDNVVVRDDGAGVGEAVGV